MKAIFLSTSFFMLASAYTGSGAIDFDSDYYREQKYEYIEQAVHRIPADVALRREDAVRIALGNQSIDSLTALLKNRSGKR